MNPSVIELIKRLESLGPDPLDVLAEALKKGEEPPCEWVERWSLWNPEPVAAAWAITRSPLAPLLLLALAGRYEDLDVAARAAGLLRPQDPPFPREGLLDAIDREYFFAFFGFGEEHHQRAIDAIRSAVPVPPTLEELRAAVKPRKP